MQVHFLKTKTNEGHVAICNKKYCAPRNGFRRAVNGRYFPVTTDPSKINCKKCAAALGVTLQEKVSSTKQGTCPCCFDGFKVSGNAGTSMSLHGYKRPGHGWIVGGCPGTRELPFEVSCDGTKKYLNTVLKFIKQQENLINDLESGKVKSLYAKVYLRQKTHDSTGWPIWTHEMIEILEGAEEVSTSEKYKAIPSFEQVKQNQISSAKQQIRNAQNAVRQLEEKIANWKKVW